MTKKEIDHFLGLKIGGKELLSINAKYGLQLCDGTTYRQALQGHAEHLRKESAVWQMMAVLYREDLRMRQKAAKRRGKKADAADGWSLGISDDWGSDIFEDWVDPNEFQWDLCLDFSPEDDTT